LIEQQVHVAQICFSNLLDAGLAGLGSTNVDAMTLSVEGVTVFGHLAIKRLDGEVPLSAVRDFCNGYFTEDLLLLPRISEMVLLFLNPMVALNENVVVIYEGTGDKWLVESRDWL
jgi:hypothetical protein